MNMNDKLIVKEHINILNYFMSKLMFERKKGAEFYFYESSEQKTASISVNVEKQVWRNYRNGNGGDIFTAIAEFENINKFNEQVEFAKKLDVATAVTIQNTELEVQELKMNKVFETVQHQALKNYMIERNIIQHKNLHEVHFGENYYALGWKNDSGGYDLRNKYFKGKIIANDVTSSITGNENLAVFEGFTDFLSYKNNNDIELDWIVLNSTGNIEKGIKLLKEIKANIFLFLDNDHAGEKATQKIQKIIVAKDMRSKYAAEKDVAEHYFLRNIKK